MIVRFGAPFVALPGIQRSTAVVEAIGGDTANIKPLTEAQAAAINARYAAPVDETLVVDDGFINDAQPVILPITTSSQGVEAAGESSGIDWRTFAVLGVALAFAFFNRSTP